MSALAVNEKALRNYQVQIVFGARHRDIEQSTLFFQFLRRAGAKVGWDASIDGIDDKDRFPLLSFCRVDRGQNQVVLIKQGNAGLW